MFDFCSVRLLKEFRGLLIELLYDTTTACTKDPARAVLLMLPTVAAR